MRQFQFIVQAFAVLILLIHSIVPHQHHAELTDAEHSEQHTEASSFFDYIALSFHFDHPDGQLEEFTTAQTDANEVDQLTQIAEIPSSFGGPVLHINSEEQNHFCTYQVDNQEVSTSAHSLRGPPALL